MASINTLIRLGMKEFKKVPGSLPVGAQSSGQEGLGWNCFKRELSLEELGGQQQQEGGHSKDAESIGGGAKETSPPQPSWSF